MKFRKDMSNNKLKPIFNVGDIIYSRNNNSKCIIIGKQAVGYMTFTYLIKEIATTLVSSVFGNSYITYSYYYKEERLVSYR